MASGPWDLSLRASRGLLRAVEAIIEDHRGYLDLESHEGEGFD